MDKFLRFNPWRSLTFWGVVTLAANTAIQTADPAALTPQAVNIITTIGAVLSILGVRRAQEPRP